MWIDPIIQEKLINEISNNNEDIFLTKLALTDILDEYDINNMLDFYYKYHHMRIRICVKIETTDDKFYKLKFICKEGDIIDNHAIKHILNNYCSITNTVKPAMKLAVNICKNNKIIGYNNYPYLYLFHLDDIRAVKFRPG